jgi:hypothetical protein
MLRFVSFVTATILCSALIVLSAPASEQIPRSGPARVERAEARLVQVDVSVIDPKKSPYRSMPGLQLDQFDIRLDGVKLTTEQRAAVKFDPMCDDHAAESGRWVVVLVDFNYVDERGRLAVSRALDELAITAKSGAEVYKFYAMTRQLRALNAGFTKDPVEIQRVARLIRQESGSPLDSAPKKSEKDIRANPEPAATAEQKDRVQVPKKALEYYMKRFCSG